MRVIMNLVKRHTLLFVKDKTAVFFSFMAVFVVLFLYICFLGDFMIKPLENKLPATAREISDTWIMAGTLGIVSLTTSLSVLGIVIQDRSTHIVDDFRIAPISRMQIALSYILSTIVVTFCISLITLGIAEVYILTYGGQLMSIQTLFKVLGCMIVSILSCTVMLYFLMSFFHSTTSFSNVTTIIGTLSGFLMGIYVPVGSLPLFLQKIIAWFPPSHCAALYRQFMMEDVVRRSFPNPQGVAIVKFKEQFGLTYTYHGHVTTIFDSIVILCIVTIIFLFLIWLSQKYKKKQRKRHI